MSLALHHYHYSTSLQTSSCQKEGYEDGFSEGRLKGWTKGCETGYKQGKEIGSEVFRSHIDMYPPQIKPNIIQLKFVFNPLSGDDGRMQHSMPN